MLMLSLLRRLLRDRRGAAAVIVAVTLPATLVGVAFAVETAFVQVRESQLQTIADATAGAAREKLNPYMPTYLNPDGSGGQQDPIDEVTRIAAGNDLPTAVAPVDIKQGWWDITSAADDKFGPPIAGQTGSPFSNAVRITAREDHQFTMGGLIGRSHVPLAASSTAYKCSNLDYPLTRIIDDPSPPDQPAIYYSWSTPAHPDDTNSYYFDNPVDGRRNPIIKLWSPTDGLDVSFVLFNSDGSFLQVDTYCRGTFLVIPDAFNWKNLARPITGTIHRGSTNNSFATYPDDQARYPLAFRSTTYNNDPAHVFPLEVQFLHPDLVHTTPYPSSRGIQYWASEGDPTPDRRTLIVR